MTFYPYQPPKTLTTAAIHLEPLHPDHLHLDYEAVMASREMLNLWSGSPWPRPDFTLEENLRDLQWHHEEHQEGQAFTYTILNPDQTLCLGCLYIRPLKELAEYNPGKLEQITGEEALARYWLRSSHSGGAFESQVLDSLIDWFEQSWHFPQIYFHTRPENQAQINLFQSSRLSYRFELSYPRRGGSHHFYR